MYSNGNVSNTLECSFLSRYILVKCRVKASLQYQIMSHLAKNIFSLVYVIFKLVQKTFFLIRGANQIEKF